MFTKLTKPQNNKPTMFDTNNKYLQSTITFCNLIASTSIDFIEKFSPYFQQFIIIQLNITVVKWTQYPLFIVLSKISFQNITANQKINISKMLHWRQFSGKFNSTKYQPLIAITISKIIWHKASSVVSIN